ncbi:MAG: hypothetical protein LYZ69_07030 [Nitrososphaerales archaeon]|nr:hypothetical protein [Nitrososphaerales archaeon]
MIVGLAAYVLVVLIQGIGFGELLKAWKPEDDMASRFAIALGVGISSSGVSMLVFTSGFSIFGIELLGIGGAAVYLPVGIGLVALFASIVARRRFSFPRMPSWGDCLIAVLIAAQLIMLIQYFGQFPFFPQYPSADFIQHFNLARAILAGQISSIPSGILYFGVHYQIGMAMFFSGVDTNVARYTVGILAVFSTPLFYLAAAKIFKNRNGAYAGAAIYVLTATVWFGNLFNSGLYPEFYGLISLLFILAVMAPLLNEPKRPAPWFLFLLALASGFISHYAVLVLLPVLLVMTLVSLTKSREDRITWFLLLGILAVPAVLGVLLFPSYSNTILGFLAPSPVSQNVLGTTPLATLLSPVPVVSYMAVVTTNDLGALILFALAAVSLARQRGINNATSFLPAIFAGVIIVASPFNSVAWRFSFIGLVFLTMMAGVGITMLIPQGRIGKRKVVGLSLALLCLGATFVGSWGERMLTPVPQSAEIQGYVHSAIGWLNDNTPRTSVYYSVTDWRFTEMTYMLFRRTVYGFTSNITDAFKTAAGFQLQKPKFVAAISNNLWDTTDTSPTRLINATIVWYLPPTYMIVTKFVTEDLPSNPSVYPWNTFAPNANMSLVYTNPDVEVFRIATITSCHVLPQFAPEYVLECP